MKFRAMLGAGIGSALLPDGNALGLHYVMFTPTIMGQVSDILSQDHIPLPKNLHS
jgi:hypothetical protein